MGVCKLQKETQKELLTKDEKSCHAGSYIVYLDVYAGVTYFVGAASAALAASDAGEVGCLPVPQLPTLRSVRRDTCFALSEPLGTPAARRDPSAQSSAETAAKRSANVGAASC